MHILNIATTIKKMTANELRELKKNGKSVKPTEIVTYQPKNIVDTKSVITELPKTSHKLSKTKKQAEKIAYNSSLYSNTKKGRVFKRKKCKNNKTSTCF